MSNHQLSGSPIFQTNPACTSKSPALVDILLNRVLTCETTGNRFYEFCQSYCTILDLYAWLPHFFNGLGMVLFSCSHLSTVDAPWMESWDVSPMRIWLKLITQKKKDNLGFLGTAGTARSVSPPAYGLRNPNVPRSYCCCTWKWFEHFYWFMPVNIPDGTTADV